MIILKVTKWWLITFSFIVPSVYNCYINKDYVFALINKNIPIYFISKIIFFILLNTYIKKILFYPPHFLPPILSGTQRLLSLLNSWHFVLSLMKFPWVQLLLTMWEWVWYHWGIINLLEAIFSKKKRFSLNYSELPVDAQETLFPSCWNPYWLNLLQVLYTPP